MRLNIERTIYSLFFIFVSLMSIVGMVGVTAVKYTINGDSLVSELDLAAKVQSVALMTKKCLDVIDTDDQSREEMLEGQFVSSYPNGQSVGFWLAGQINEGGKLENGWAACYYKSAWAGTLATSLVAKPIFLIFAQYMLGSEDEFMNTIVCGNADATEEENKKPFVPKVNGSPTAVCGNADEFMIRDGDEWKEAIRNIFKNIYNNYVVASSNKYLLPWDSLDEFWTKVPVPPSLFGDNDISMLDVLKNTQEYIVYAMKNSYIPQAIKYRLYYNDFMAGCFGDKNKYVSIDAVSLDYNGGTFGKKIDEAYLVTNDSGAYSLGTLYDNGSIYCSNDEKLTFASRMKENVDGYNKALLLNLDSLCFDAINAEIASLNEEWQQVAVEDSSKAGAIMEKITHLESKLREAGEEGLIEQTEQGGWVCTDVDINVTITEPSDPGETDYEQDACYSASGSLSWIVCPVMQKLGGALDWVYDEMVEPFLKVNKGLLSGSEGTREAWGVVVGFANLAVVIFILIIIFSQLTGVGIDNYGIKKSLPKVVIAAVLINFSFVICQVAVDISNIVGNGLNSTLSGIDLGDSYKCDGNSGLTLSGDGGNSACVPISSGSSEQAGMFKTMFNVAAGGLIGVGVVSVVSNVLSTGFLAGFLIPILLLLVTAVIAVLFFFVLLGMRQAGVVILVVLSPLALACYMLPNMKKYYDKWFKAFSGLLLVYPICGLLIGGGQLTSKIILSASTNYMTYFVGCVLMVAPFFLIPSLLKGSFAAMGNIGAKVSGLGKSFGSKGRSSLDRGIKNSNRYQQRVKENQERQALRRANRIHNRLHGKFDNVDDVSKLSRRQRRQLTRLRQADSTILGRDAELYSAKNMSGSGYDAAQTAQRKKADADALANEMMLIKSNTNDGANEAAVQEIFNNAMKSGNYMQARAAMRIAGRRKDTAANFLKGTLLDSNNNYSSEALSKVMKEISEGETSANWRSGSPVAFEYASRINDGSTDKSYTDWANDSNNIHNALDHHVTTASDLMGIQGSNLSSLVRSVQSGAMLEGDANRIGHLAREAIKSNKEHGTQFDTTKAKQIYELAYGSQYQEKMREDGLIRTDSRRDVYGGGYSDDTSASD